MAKSSFIGKPITRRQFLKASSVASAGLVTSPTIWPKISWSAEGNILKARSIAEINSIDPAFYTTSSEVHIMDCIFSKLIDYKPGNEWGWQLSGAESMEQVDSTHIKFKLRPGIMFTNGFGELTAEDVKFSFERIVDPKLGSTCAVEWGPLDHVEVTGKYSGTIIFKSPFQPVWMMTLTYNSGHILSRKGLESIGGKFKTSPPCYSGPYILKEWKPKQRTILVRNELWNGPKTDFDEIHIYQIDDDKSAEIAYEAGDIDFTRLSLSSLQSFSATPPKDTKIAKYPALSYTWLGMNMEHPKLKDARLRKAIQKAIDVQMIIDATYFGAANVATGTVAPGIIGYREKTLIPPEADIEGAKSLLKEAGYQDGISLTLDIPSTTEFATAAQVIQASLAQTGIQLQINTHESGAFWTLGDESAGERWKDIQLILNQFSSSPDPFYATAWFVGEQVGVWNWERFRSEEYDSLYERSMAEADPTKRGKLIKRMQDIMEETGCYRFITNGINSYMWRSTIIPALRPDGLPLYQFFKKA